MTGNVPKLHVGRGFYPKNFLQSAAIKILISWQKSTASGLRIVGGVSGALRQLTTGGAVYSISGCVYWFINTFKAFNVIHFDDFPFVSTSFIILPLKVFSKSHLFSLFCFIFNFSIASSIRES